MPPTSKELKEFPELVRHEFINEKTDVVFSGLVGFVSKAKIAAWRLRCGCGDPQGDYLDVSPGYIC